MTHEPYDTLAAVYALDALDGDDLALFREHLAQGCAHCAATLRESQSTLAALALATAPAPPPPGVREALLARAADTGFRPTIEPPPEEARRRAEAARKQTAGPRWRWVPWAIGVVAASIATGFFTAGVVASRYEARLGQVAREMTALRERAQREEAALRDQLAAVSGVVDLLRDPATRVVALEGAGPAPEARGRVVWSQSAGGYFFARNLAPAPADKTYEMWTITAGTPKPAGLFQVDSGGIASGRLEAAGADAAPVEVFAVTIEPAGGSPAPTGPVVLASK